MVRYWCPSGTCGRKAYAVRRRPLPEPRFKCVFCSKWFSTSEIAVVNPRVLSEEQKYLRSKSTKI